jgi:aspartate/methionine/tyrosine aminotransferase
MNASYPGGIGYIDWARANLGTTSVDLRFSGVFPRAADGLSIDWEAVAHTLGAGREAALEFALSERVAERYGVGVEQVTMAGGASGINFHVVAGLVPPGGEVLVERPAYEPLWAIPQLLGRTVRFFDRPLDRGFEVDPARVESALTRDTRLVIVTRLHNPTGVDISIETLRALGAIAEAHDIWVLVDEVYADFLADPTSAVHIHPRLLSTNSLTKVYGLPWLRAGWCLATPEASVAIRQARDRGEVAWGAADRALGLVLWDRLDALRDEAIAIAGRGLAIAEEVLSRSERAQMVPPAGGLVGFVHWGGDEQAITARLEAKGVGVTPGHFFNLPGGVRVGWGGEASVVERGFEALIAEIEAE